MAALVEKAGQREYSGMFEAVIESMKECQQEAWEEGHDSGLHQGAENEKLQTAANLKKLDVSIDIIVQATSLSPEEIAGL